MNEFLRLQASCTLKESEEQTVAMYISGLNQAIQKALSLLSISTFDQVKTLAMMVEKVNVQTSFEFWRNIED